jgi:hypothetical protein
MQADSGDLGRSHQRDKPGSMILLDIMCLDTFIPCMYTIWELGVAVMMIDGVIVPLSDSYFIFFLPFHFFYTSIKSCKAKLVFP